MFEIKIIFLQHKTTAFVFDWLPAEYVYDTCTCTHVAEVAVTQHKHSFARSLACRFRFVVKKIAYSFTLSVPLLYHTASFIVKNVACDSRLWSARLFKPVRRWGLRGLNLNYRAVAMQNCYPPYFKPCKSNSRGTWPTMWSPSVLQMLVVIFIFGMSRDQNKKRPKSQTKYARYCRHGSARSDPMFFTMLRMDFPNFYIFWKLLHHKGSVWHIFLNSFKFV